MDSELQARHNKLLEDFAALEAERDALRDERDSAIGDRYRAERELGATRYDLTSLRERNRALVEALERLLMHNSHVPTAAEDQDRIFANTVLTAHRKAQGKDDHV